MNYLTPQEFSEKWNMCLRQVQYLCSNNRIPGARKINRRWMIPASAKCPGDFRKEKRKSAVTPEVYHFPLFVYSNYYVSNNDFSEEEKELLRAQIMMLQCKYVESIQICRRLSETSNSDFVRFGAYCTNTFSYVVMGLYDELMKCMDSMEKIYEESLENSSEYAEDYHFLIVSRRFEFSSNPAELLEIDVTKLGPEALICYECNMLESIVFKEEAETDNAISMYEAFCKRMEESGIIPAAMTAHGILALLCERRNDPSKMERHISEMCRIGYEEKFVKLIAKYLVLIPDKYFYYLSGYGSDFVKKVRAQDKKDYNGWKMIYSRTRNTEEFLEYDSQERELILFLSYEMTNKEIATVKNMEPGKIAKMIKILCDKTGSKNRTELKTLAKQLMNHK